MIIKGEFYWLHLLLICVYEFELNLVITLDTDMDQWKWSNWQNCAITAESNQSIRVRMNDKLL